MVTKVEAAASKPKRKYVYKDKPVVAANSWPFAAEGASVPMVSKPVRVKQVRKSKVESVEVEVTPPPFATGWPFPNHHLKEEKK